MQVIKDKKTDPGHLQTFVQVETPFLTGSIRKGKKRGVKGLSAFQLSLALQFYDCHLLLQQEKWQFKISSTLIWISTTSYFVMAFVSYEKSM